MKRNIGNVIRLFCCTPTARVGGVSLSDAVECRERGEAGEENGTWHEKRNNALGSLSPIWSLKILCVSGQRKEDWTLRIERRSTDIFLPWMHKRFGKQNCERKQSMRACDGECEKNDDKIRKENIVAQYRLIFLLLLLSNLLESWCVFLFPVDLDNFFGILTGRPRPRKGNFAMTIVDAANEVYCWKEWSRRRQWCWEWIQSQIMK